MNESPGKGRGHNRDGLYHQPIPVEPTVWGDRFRARSFSPERQTVFGEPTRPFQAFTDRLSADLTSKAAETLRSPNGGVPAVRGEAAATSERSERKREAVRWAVGAEVCGAVGCGRSDGLLSVATGDGRRVLCPEHARRWAQ